MKLTITIKNNLQAVEQNSAEIISPSTALIQPYFHQSPTAKESRSSPLTKDDAQATGDVAETNHVRASMQAVYNDRRRDAILYLSTVPLDVWREIERRMVHFFIQDVTSPRVSEWVVLCLLLVLVRRRHVSI